MNILTPARMSDITQLLARLHRYGVTAPTQVDHIIGLHHGIGDGKALTTQAPDLLTCSANQLVDYIQESAQLAAHKDDVTNAAWRMDGVLAAAAVPILAEHADEFIDALRPAFDEAAKTVNAAAAAGIQPNHAADNVIALGDDAVGLWRALPAQVAILDGIAAIRITMSTLLGITPQSSETLNDAPVDYASCFSGLTAGFNLPNESYLTRWLRLATGVLHLASIQDTHDLRRAQVRNSVPAVWLDAGRVAAPEPKTTKTTAHR